jgi:hypothetical protein
MRKSSTNSIEILYVSRLQMVASSPSSRLLTKPSARPPVRPRRRTQSPPHPLVSESVFRVGGFSDCGPEPVGQRACPRVGQPSDIDVGIRYVGRAFSTHDVHSRSVCQCSSRTTRSCSGRCGTQFKSAVWDRHSSSSWQVTETHAKPATAAVKGRVRSVNVLAS